MATGTIYYILHRESGRGYVGQTRQLVKKRWWAHFHEKKPLQDALLAFGKDAFDFVVLDEVPVDRLNEFEGGWITMLGTMHPNGFNHTAGGDRPTSVSEQTRAKQSAAKMGKKRGPHSPEHCARISAARQGHEVTPETRAKLSVAMRARKGEKRSLEFCQKLSNANKGKRPPQHVLDAARAGSVGRKWSVEERELRRIVRQDRIISDTTRQKYRDAANKRWTREREGATCP